MDISSVRRRDSISRDVPFDVPFDVPNVAPLDATFGALLGDVAAHAQGIVRAEVRLAIAQVREELRVGTRRATLRASGGVFIVLGMMLLLGAGALFLSTVVAAWMALSIIAGVAFIVAFILMSVAGRNSA